MSSADAPVPGGDDTTPGDRSEDVDSDIQVLILEDHQLLSASLAAALQAEGYPVVAPDLADRPGLLAYITKERPRVALLDLDLGSFGSGEELLPSLVESGCRVLIVSANTDAAVTGRCLEAGAWGWVPKSASFEQLLDSILLAASGRPVLTEADRDRLLRSWRERRQAVAETFEPFWRLTSREAAVLEMLQAGKSVDRIASESFVSEATVRTQVRAILTKLGVNSQLEAVAKAARAGWKR